MLRDKRLLSSSFSPKGMGVEELEMAEKFFKKPSPRRCKCRNTMLT